SAPGTADLGITVASYNEVSGRTSGSSSQGPRIDGARKPDVMAPGDAIHAARNSLTTLWTTRSGTSMAAPHVAGVLALIRQASNNDNGWTDLTTLFAGAGKNDDHYSPPTSGRGYGLVDPAWSSQHLLDPELDEIYWAGIDPLIADAVDTTINSSLDITEIKVHQTLGTLSVAVRMNGIVDLTGNNVLTVYWDIDSSMSTGLLGIDLLLNITNEQATLFEWSGSAYQSVSSNVDWLNNSQTVTIKLQRTDSSQYGRISVMTSNETTSPLDETTFTYIPNQWRPFVNSLSIIIDGTNYGIDVEIADVDSPNSFLEIGMIVIDGAQNILDSEIVTGVNSTLFQIETSDFDTDDILNVVLNISDGSETIYLPYIALTTGLNTNIRFINATLDQEIIRIGPLISEQITGRVVLSGHLFVSDVRLSFISSIGLKLNLTLNGVNGIYDFNVSPAGFSVGDYDVYAIAYSQSGIPLELHFATISIEQDYTIVVILGGIAAICLIMIVIIRNRP
ncbi:MAG: S8 family serine peptidase, partial [Candidatus Thorarchaeota archaeon]